MASKTEAKLVRSLRSPSGAEIHLVGTAHVATSSAERVSETLSRVSPDAVMVELDKGRASWLMSADDANRSPARSACSRRDGEGEAKGSDNSPARSACSRRVGEGEAKGSDKSSNGLLSTLQEQLRRSSSGASALGSVMGTLYGEMANSGIEVGEEFRTAIRYAKAKGIPILYGDTSLTEIMAKVSKQDLMKMLQIEMAALSPTSTTTASCTGGSLKSDASARRLALHAQDAMEEKGLVSSMLATLKDAAPRLHKTLVSDRDAAMAETLSLAAKDGHRTLVGVVGAAHLDGVVHHLSRAGFVPSSTKTPPSNGGDAQSSQSSAEAILALCREELPKASFHGLVKSRSDGRYCSVLLEKPGAERDTDAFRAQAAKISHAISRALETDPAEIIETLDRTTNAHPRSLMSVLGPAIKAKRKLVLVPTAPNQLHVSLADCSSKKATGKVSVSFTPVARPWSDDAKGHSTTETPLLCYPTKPRLDRRTQLIKAGWVSLHCSLRRDERQQEDSKQNQPSSSASPHYQPRDSLYFHISLGWIGVRGMSLEDFEPYNDQEHTRAKHVG